MVNLGKPEENDIEQQQQQIDEHKIKLFVK